MAAVALLPMPFVLLPIARGAPLVAERVGFRRVAPAGLLLMAIGFALLSQLRIDTSYWFFLVGLLFFAAGMGLAGTPSTTAITSALSESKQGVASALNDTARELGSAFGIAILGSILNQAYRDGMSGAVAGLPPQIGDRILASVAFVSVPEVHQLPGADALIATAQQSFLNGVTAAVFAGSVILFVAAIVVFALSPAHEPRTSDDAATAAAPSAPSGAAQAAPSAAQSTGVSPAALRRRTDIASARPRQLAGVLCEQISPAPVRPPF